MFPLESRPAAVGGKEDPYGMIGVEGPLTSTPTKWRSKCQSGGEAGDSGGWHCRPKQDHRQNLGPGVLRLVDTVPSVPQATPTCTEGGRCHNVQEKAN